MSSAEGRGRTNTAVTPEVIALPPPDEAIEGEDILPEAQLQIPPPAEVIALPPPENSAPIAIGAPPEVTALPPPEKGRHIAAELVKDGAVAVGTHIADRVLDRVFGPQNMSASTPQTEKYAPVAGGAASNVDAWTNLPENKSLPADAEHEPQKKGAKENWDAWQETTGNAPKPPEPPATTEPTPTGPELAAKRRENAADPGAAERLTNLMLMNARNMGFLEKMSTGGKSLLSKAYESVINAPGKLLEYSKESAHLFLHRTGAKMEIAYSQFWGDRHEKQAAIQKGKLDLFDMQATQLKQGRADLAATIENLKRQGAPGSAGLELGLKNFDRQLAEIQTKRDPIQSKFEKRINKRNGYVNERDRVADGVINLYNEKMGPMERKLEFLGECKDRADLLIAGTEAKQKVAYDRIAATERKIGELEEMQKAIGTKERQLRKMFGPMKEAAAADRRRLEEEMEPHLRQRTEVEARIAAVDKKANPYRDRRDEYARIRNERPIDFGVEKRSRVEASTERENISDNTRLEESAAATKEPEDDSEKTESTESSESAKQAGKLVDGWNDYLKEKYKPGVVPANEILNPKKFLSSINHRAEDPMEPETLTNLLGLYYKQRKIAEDTFKKDYPEFIKKMKEVA